MAPPTSAIGQTLKDSNSLMSKAKEFSESSARAVARPGAAATPMLLSQAKTVEGVE